LTVGEVKTAVTVEAADVTQVETESSEVSGIVTEKQITQLVLNGRNFTRLVTLRPQSPAQSVAHKRRHGPVQEVRDHRVQGVRVSC
jgi:hypothetical protein